MMLERYSRLLQLSDFSKEKLSLLQSTKVLIVGSGGVGQNISLELVSNGFENITIIDFDKVEISNLNRQVLLTENDLGKNKVEIVKKALEARNKDAKITAINAKIDKDNVNKYLSGFDIVIDATDNWPSKLIISDYIKKINGTLLHIGVDGYVGQFVIFKNKSLRDVVDEKVFASKKDGVSGPMVSTISSLAALYLIDYITKENPSSDVLYFYDHKAQNFSKIKL